MIDLGAGWAPGVDLDRAPWAAPWAALFLLLVVFAKNKFPKREVVAVVVVAAAAGVAALLLLLLLLLWAAALLLRVVMVRAVVLLELDPALYLPYQTLVLIIALSLDLPVPPVVHGD
jgi:hypothetical protein